MKSITDCEFMTDMSTGESTPQARTRLGGIDSALIVLLITAYAYSLGFSYEFGYLSHFGVPLEFVDIGVHELLVFGAVTVGSLGVFYIVLDILTYQIPSHVAPLVKLTIVYVFAFAILTAVILRITHAPPSGYLVGFVFGPGWLTFKHFIVPIWSQPKELSYWRRVEAAEERRAKQLRKGHTLTDFVAQVVGPAGFFLLLLAVAALFIANQYGEFRAGQDDIFLIPSEPPTCIVLRMEAAGLLCVGIDEKSRRALPEYHFLDPKTTDLVLRRVGPFAPVHVRKGV